MKFFLNLTPIFFFIFTLKAEKYIYESSSSVISDHIKISEDLTSTTVNIESRCKTPMENMVQVNVMDIY